MKIQVKKLRKAYERAVENNLETFKLIENKEELVYTVVMNIYFLQLVKNYMILNYQIPDFLLVNNLLKKENEE